MTAFPEDELQAHAQALRHLARALVGAQDADDLVQDAALQALVRPPREGGSWFGWLAAVVRHRAGKLQRGEQRRRRREAAAEPFAVAASPVGAAAQREMVQRLHAALMGLAEPYQGALLLRYFEGLLPNEIAARMREPVATVKSRLQRGLGILRERLADGRGDDWRAGLVAAFGLGVERGGVMAIAGMGGVLMTTKWLLGAAAVLLAVLLVGPETSAPRAVEALDASTAPTPVAGAGHVAPTVNERVAVAIAEPAPAPEAGAPPKVVLYVGRCVDASARPLADVAILARAEGDGKPSARTEQRTGEDGRFAVELPRARRVHNLELSGAERWLIEGHLDPGVLGDRVDLGDVYLPTRCVVRARVVDGRGTTQTGLRLWLWPEHRDPSRQLAPRGVDEEKEVDAAGCAEWQVPAGAYGLGSRDRALVTERPTFVVGEGEQGRVLDVELVVEPAPKPCCGQVVDAAGAPRPGVAVTFDDDHAVTDAQGRFSLRPDVRATGKRVVRATASKGEAGTATWTPGDPSDVRIVLAPPERPSMTLLVIDGRTQRPCEEFAIEEIGMSLHVHSSGFHAGGLCELARKNPGNGDTFRVRAADATLAPSLMLPWPDTGDLRTQLRVELDPLQTRRARISFGDRVRGGVEVQLIDPVGGVLSGQTFVWDMADLHGQAGRNAYILDKAETDEQGSCLLRGPAGPLALRFVQPGMPCLIVQPVRVDQPGDLVVRLPLGTRLIGRLIPSDVAPAVVASVVASVTPANHRSSPRGVRIQNAQGDLHPGWDRAYPIRPDGTFDISGIPPGSWNIVIGTDRASATVATVLCVDGATLEQDFDIRALAPADVELEIRVDGQPVMDCVANAYGQHACFGVPFGTQHRGRTDAKGIVAVETCVGTLDVRLSVHEVAELRTIVPVARAGAYRQTVDIQIGHLDLTLLAPTETPVVEADLRLEQDGAAFPLLYGLDANGRLRCKLAAGVYEVRMLPKRLLAQEARAEFLRMRADGHAALEASWQSVGTITVAPGPAVPQTLRLPEAWSR